jgi:hypothetical protein
LHRSEPGVWWELNIWGEELDELGITIHQTKYGDDNYRQGAQRMKKSADFMNFTNKERTFISNNVS